MSGNKIVISVKDMPEMIEQLKQAGNEIERLKDLIKALWNNNYTSNLNDKQLELLDNIIFDKEKDNE